MRTGAVVVLLLLLMAVPVRAADPPPDLKALYEFGPAPGAAIPFAEEKRHSAMRLTALGFGARAGLWRAGAGRSASCWSGCRHRFPRSTGSAI